MKQPPPTPPQNILDHWHPVLSATQLKAAPVEVQLGGHRIVLFRDAQGQVGALSNRCPHRGMNLSHGKVNKDGLSCPYHGWTFNTDGQGRSPCNPKLKVRATAYSAREYAGFVWVTGNHSAPFPEFIPPGFRVVGAHVRTIAAPLEPVMDNFLEVEHFPVAHRWLNVDFKQIGDAEVSFGIGENEVQMGFYPVTRLDPPVRWVFRLPTESRYFMDITAHASPLYTVHHQGWRDPVGGRKKTLLINGVFYVPIDREQTLLVMFLLAETGPFSLIKNAFIRKETGRLIDDDLKILNHLADKQMRVHEMRLGAYDKALIEVRRRLPRIYADYYSSAPAPLRAVPPMDETQTGPGEGADLARRSGLLE